MEKIHWHLNQNNLEILQENMKRMINEDKLRQRLILTYRKQMVRELIMQVYVNKIGQFLIYALQRCN